MADLTALDDVGHYWGGDVILGLTGDFSRASHADRSKQRVLRRLLTNPGDYIFHPAYGAGLPKLVGQAIDLPKTQALIRGQMLLEASVAKSPGPTIKARLIPGGLSVAISYTVLPDRQPVSLSFSVEG